MLSEFQGVGGPHSIAEVVIPKCFQIGICVVVNFYIWYQRISPSTRPQPPIMVHIRISYQSSVKAADCSKTSLLQQPKAAASAQRGSLDPTFIYAFPDANGCARATAIDPSHERHISRRNGTDPSCMSASWVNK